SASTFAPKWSRVHTFSSVGSFGICERITGNGEVLTLIGFMCVMASEKWKV
ncbi:unnamed protein product, partial [Sphenostylis stenocarpa]